MQSFKAILKKSERNLLGDMYYSEDRAQLLYRMIQQYFKENPEASDFNVYQHFTELFAQTNDDIMHIPTIKSHTLRYNICRYLNENPQKLRESYDEIIRDEENGEKIYIESSVAYNANILSETRQLTLEILNELRQKQGSYDTEKAMSLIKFFRSPKSAQNDVKRHLSSAGRREFEELKELFSGDEFTELTNMFKKKEKEFEKSLKDEYVESIAFLGTLLNKFGLLESYNKNNDHILKGFGLENLSYPLKKDEENTISVESAFSKEKLNMMHLNQLSALNAFWINRFTKAIDSMNRTFFIVGELGVFPEIRRAKPDKKNGYIRVDIDKKRLENLYKKMNFLEQSSEALLDEMTDITNRQKKEIGEETKVADRTVIRVNLEPILRNLDENIGDEYEKYFSTLEDGEAQSFLDDISRFITMENAKYNAYKLKDMNMIAILSDLIHGKFSNNWGIILEDEKKIKNAKKILLGMDVEGMNMPIRLHIEKDLIKDFLQANQDTSLIPIYEGAKDFVVFYRHIGTQILMPLCKKQKEGIKQKLEKDTIAKNFLEHLIFLANPDEYPEHLKEDVVVKKKGKTKVVRRRPHKKFVDLNTGEIYQQSNSSQSVGVKQDIDRGEK